MNKFLKKLSAVLASMAIAFGMTATAFASFGPSRPTKAWTSGVDGFDHVTFNSFTGVGNGVGNEQDFLRGVVVGRDSVWSDPVNNVSQDAEVEAKIYIHNNADARLNEQPGNPGIAKNVQVRVDLPTGSKQGQQITSFIKADNAQPGEVYDTLDINGANNGFFELEYVPGSAKLHKNGQATALSDNLVSTGVNIGDIKGCFEFVQEVTFRVKVKMPRYTIAKSVRYEGQTSNDWKENLDVRRGQTVEWRIEFKNAGQTELKNVKIVDEVPPFMTVVPGSVRLFNGNYPNGYTYPDTSIQANGKQVNVDIGNYLPGINAYVLFKTKINDASEIKCGTHKLVNIAYATPTGYGAVSDGAEVFVVNDAVCAEKPKQLPKTGAGDVLGIFAAVTVAGAVAHRLVYARRLS